MKIEQKHPGIDEIIEEYRKKGIEKKRRIGRQVRFRTAKHRKRVQKKYLRKRYF